MTYADAMLLDTPAILEKAVGKMIDAERYRWNVTYDGVVYVVIEGTGRIIAKCPRSCHAEEIAALHNDALAAMAKG